MKKIFASLVMFLLMCGLVSADPDFVLNKPNIPTDKILNAQERNEVKDYLKGKIFKELQPAKNDYDNKYDRGTVNFNFKRGVNMLGREVFEASNYSFHKVIIPDGTTITECNFTQAKPYTNAIKGKNLTFKNCNLANVKLDPSWIIDGSFIIQIKSEVRENNGKSFRHTFVIPRGKIQWEETTVEEVFDDIVDAFDSTE